MTPLDIMLTTPDSSTFYTPKAARYVDDPPLVDPSAG